MNLREARFPTELRPEDVYIHTERVYNYILMNKLNIIGFRIPVNGERFVADLYNVDTIRARQNIAITLPRFIVEENVPEQTTPVITIEGVYGKPLKELKIPNNFRVVAFDEVSRYPDKYFLSVAEEPVQLLYRSTYAGHYRIILEKIIK